MLWHSTSRLLGLITIGLLIIFLATRSPWRHKIFKPIDTVPNDAEALCASVDQTARSDPEWHLRPPILPGVQVSSEQHHSKMLVVAAVHYNDTDWIRERLPNMQTVIYVAEDPSARLQPPKNKGNEVMIYLTYIIDHYDELCEITIFMHSHQFSWHNNPVLNFNAYEMLTRLNHDRVSQEGYMNLRCDWFPGCPDWIHPGHVQEEGMQNGEWQTGRVWNELFPLDDMPAILAQPCCGQFALSRARILAVPKTRFIFFRDWLLETDLPNCLSGRIWEYLWQYVFLGKTVYCPSQHTCYCDGYGICFENDQMLDEWMELSIKQDEREKRLKGLQSVVDAAPGEMPEVGELLGLEQDIKQNQELLDEKRAAAILRGNDMRRSSGDR
jgi:Protein of unknown function (DUF3431)